MCGDASDSGGGGDSTGSSDVSAFDSNSAGTASYDAFGNTVDSMSSPNQDMGQVAANQTAASSMDYGYDYGDSGWGYTQDNGALGMTESQRGDFVDNYMGNLGYSSSYMGTNAVDRDGNAVMSGSYASSLADANASFDAINASHTMDMQNEAAFGTSYQSAIEAGKAVPTELLDVINGKGKNGQATSAERDAAYAQLGTLAAQGYAFPDATYGNPFGNVVGTSTSNMLGSELGNFTNQDAFNSFAKGYNDQQGTFGTQITANPRGDIGFQTFGQRASDGIGGFLLGTVASSINPVLGAAAQGLQFTNMTPIGMNGYTQSSTDYNALGGLSGILGNAAANYASPAAAQAAYNATGNMNTALAAGVATGVAANEGGGYLGNTIGNVMGLGNFNLASDISLDGQSMGGGGGSTFGTTVGGDSAVSDAGSVVGSTGSAEGSILGAPSPGAAPNTSANLGDATLETYQQSTTGGDAALSGQIGDGTTTEFDPNAWFQSQMESQNLNGVRNLSGELTYEMANPLFQMAANNNVRYLTQGRQRDYGSATYSAATPLQMYKNTRRQGFGDRLTGIIV